jgi:L-ascorbate metabolism protein UlaG (beta-lactamase superfamily)
MEIKWYGHASFLLITAQGIKIITDPYEPGAYDGDIAYGPIPDEADIVTVSHDHHPDHNYVEGVAGNPIVIKETGRHEAKGIVIEGVATYHDDSKGAERGDNTVFTVIADGMRVCHLGDLGHLLNDKELQQIGQVDCLLIPVGGFFTIGPQEARQVVDQLQPKVTIPMHFKTDKCGFPIASVDQFVEGAQQVQRLDTSTFTFTKEELETGRGIVVLQPAL